MVDATDPAPAPSNDSAQATASAQPAPGDTPAVSEPASGGGDGACIVTPAEIESIFGVTGVTTANVQGPPDTCDIQQDGAPLAAIALTPAGGRIVFDVLAAGADAEPVEGIGDEAFYSAETLLLVVARGDAMASIAIFDDGRSEADRLDILRQIGTIAAGRM